MSALALLRAILKRDRKLTGEAPATFDTRYRLPGFDIGHIRRYNALLGFPADTLPVTYYYLVAQRAHLASMLRKEFPFKVAGMVHVENDLTGHSAPPLDQPLDIVTTVTLEAPADTGALYCRLDTVATHAGRPAFTCRSRYLARRGQRKHDAAPRSDEQVGPVAGTWTLTPASGRDYAAVSGDWNPIHLWAWSARLMGMKSPIIHGMHSVAKACAAIEGHTGKRVNAVSARFKAPIPLGAQASVSYAAGRDDYAVLSGGRVAVQGTLVLGSST